MGRLDLAGQLAPVDPRVADRRVRPRVAEEFLDLADVHPGPLAVRRGSPADRLRRRPYRGRDPVRQVLEPDAHAVGAESLAVTVDEERVRLGPELRAALVKVPLEPLDRRSARGAYRTFAPFPSTRMSPRAKSRSESASLVTSPVRSPAE